MNRLGRWVREPLLHFLALGAVLFAGHRWVAPPALTTRIVLSASVIRGLRQEHLRRNGSAPTPDEEAALIRRYVDNEILYREAVVQGLDRGDIIVRRRLVQKMEFVLEGAEPLPEPTDADLEAYLNTHAERYAVAARATLTHVFASADRYGADAAQVAKEFRAQVLAGADPSGLGDPFLRGRDFAQRTERDLAGIFGAAFGAQVMSLPVGPWSEPLRSSYGFHIVRVGERTEGRLPRLDEVRSAVLGDWQEEQRAQAQRAALARLRQRYEIRFEDSGKTAQASEFPLVQRADETKGMR